MVIDYDHHSNTAYISATQAYKDELAASYLSACDTSHVHSLFNSTNSRANRVPPIIDSNRLIRPPGCRDPSIEPPVPPFYGFPPLLRPTFAAKRKYKPVALKTKSVLAELPDKFRIVRDIQGDPLANMPELSPNPPPFEPTGRYTQERKEAMDSAHPGDFLTDEERKLIHHFMCKQEQAFAWDDSERGSFRSDFFPPVEIPTIPHTPWVQKNIPIPPGIYKEVCEVIKRKIDAGVYEPSNSSYRSRWFCVVKKDGKALRLVHSLEPLNAVTIRHSGVIPFADHVAEQFACRSCLGILDLYVGYDERLLAVASRDFTTFQTPYSALRLVTLPMGWTNSVPVFHDDVTYILLPEIPEFTVPFIDDVPIKGPASQYRLSDGTFETHPGNPGIRRFVWEHFGNVNRIVQRMKYSGGTFSGHKSILCAAEATIIGHRCTINGRIPDPTITERIVNWSICKSLSEVRAFLGTIGVARVFILNFSARAHQLTMLTRKDAPFIFGPKQVAAQEDLKAALLASPALRPIDYTSMACVILTVDTSYLAVGFFACQSDIENPKIRYYARFGSITLNDREARFSQAKLELYGLYRALRSMKMYLIGVRNLVVEVDATYIKGMLQNPDLAPSASINRWIIGILTFQFELVHVPGVNHGPDGLSRRPAQPGDMPNADDEDEFEDWIDRMHGFLHIINTPPPIAYSIAPKTVPVLASSTLKHHRVAEAPIQVGRESATGHQDRSASSSASSAPIQSGIQRRLFHELPFSSQPPSSPIYDSSPPLQAFVGDAQQSPQPAFEYSQIPRHATAVHIDSQLLDIQTFHETLLRPNSVPKDEFPAFIRLATQFFSDADSLWRKDKKGAHKLVVIEHDRRAAIMVEAHDKLGHRGTFATLATISERFWWPHMPSDIGWYVKTCHMCQVRQRRQIQIPPVVAIPAPLFSRLCADTFHLPTSAGYRYVVHGRCSLVHFPEYCALRRETGQTIGEWIFQDILCRWGAITEILTDNGKPFIAALDYLAKKYHITHIKISSYNSQANGIVERAHYDVRQALFKAVDGDVSHWHQALHSVFWSERVTIKRRLGCSPFYAATGVHPLLPLDVAEASYLLPPPISIMSTTDLISRRATALQKRRADLEKIHSRVYAERIANARRFEKDHAHTIQDFNFKRSRLVLVRNTRFDKTLNRKMRARYLGPLVVVSRNRGGAYIVAELDGTVYHQPIAQFRVLPYFARKSLPLPDLHLIV